ncbi:MAG TPA: Gfo/Idh/MocA family oxidoreductase [Chitinophagaceae bacterium]|nr:Gfo/Idh/MocA family oxidoreductase [Chitinophagaceae bacterium]
MKTAIIGLGPHGKRLFEAAKRISTLHMEAVVDANPKALEGLDAAYTFANYEEMLRSYGPELVIISTNGPSHFSLAEQAILSGVKKLVITKPLTCTLEDGLALMQLAQQHHVKIAVDHGLRFDITYNWLRQQIEAQTWGELLQVNIMRNGIGLGCLATHSFDLSNFLFGYHPSKVTAWVDQSYKANPRGAQFVDPGGLVILDYGHDKKTVVSQIEKAAGPMIIQLFFEDARVVVDVKYGTLEVVSQPRGAKASPGNPVKTSRDINPHGQEVSHPTVDLMEAILRDLVDHIDLKADVVHGLNAVEILVAAYQSSEQGHIPIALPVQDADYIKRFLPVT